MRFAMGVLALLFTASVSAQSWPSRPVRLIVPYPAGGATDILGRIISEKLAPMIGQPVIVENRAGASGNIGFDAVAKAAPDGYTLLMATANITINRAFNDKLPYNVLTDFQPISQVVSSQNLLVARPTLPVSNVRELIAYGKANPGKLTYGSSGIGTPLLCVELLKALGGITAVHVPYKGDTPAITDLMGGQVDLYCSTIVGLAPFTKTGKLKALGVTSNRRADSIPDVPTIAEAGVQGYELSSWYGVLAPANTPRAIVDQLNAAIVKIVAMPDVQQKMIEGGSEPKSSTPAELMDRIRSDTDKFTRLVKEANIKAE
ncbi:MAG TPA: tripartite tricarboxylate transporter substrate binding protein [Burkholderiaceae bacterium]|nr:tripartite tricarboxylate transporter substrate binding protein [Burkholderiaceae bacterium]